MLQPCYNVVVGVVTSPPYLVTTKLLVTTPVSRGCNLSVHVLAPRTKENLLSSTFLGSEGTG